ncbi:condensation domain-containing protein [Lentzea tibetensis]|nr:condensation domain-containing protein [Lentzea tibetensis]
MRGTRDRRLPLTAAQAGFWFAQHLDPDNPIYQAQETVDILGRLDVELLAQAIHAAVMDVEQLRARFERDGDLVWQVVEPCTDWLPPVIDLGDQADPWEAAGAWIRAELARPVDLGAFPLFDIAVLRLAEDRHLIHFAGHHIVGDGVSSTMWMNRVADIYTELAAGRSWTPSPMGSLRDLLADEANYRASEQYIQDRRYWRAQLDDRPAAVGFAGRPGPPSRTFRRCSHTVSAPVASRLRDLARACRASLPSLTVAALGLYVERMCGTPDVMVGMPTTGRRTAIARETPGVLASEVPLRLRVARGMTLAELVRQAAATARLALRHQRVPHEEIARDVGAIGTGDPLYGPVLNFMASEPLRSFGGHTATVHNFSNGPVDDVTINVYDRSGDGTLLIDFNSNAERYTAGHTEQHLHRFVALLEKLVDSSPDLSLDTLDVLLPAERRRVLGEWNDTARELTGPNRGRRVRTAREVHPEQHRAGVRGEPAFVPRLGRASEPVGAPDDRSGSRAGAGGGAGAVQVG